MERIMTIGLDCGHTLRGEGTGAEGCGCIEQVLTRELGGLVSRILEAGGCTVVDCTVDESSDGAGQLADRVAKANAQRLDLFVSIHFNAFNGKASGTEVLIHSEDSMARGRAESVVRNISALGYADRGVKTHKAYVLSKTHAPAMLIEVCFIDSAEDMDRYMGGKEAVATAIADGIMGGGYHTAPPPSECN